MQILLRKKRRKKNSSYIRKLKDLVSNCAYCGMELENQYKTYDHLLPKLYGGKRNISNIVICCPSCNVKKGDSHLIEFLSEEIHAHYFEHYLNTVDLLVNDKPYANLIRDRIEQMKEITLSSSSPPRKKKIEEEQTIEYKIIEGNVITLSMTQSKILDYFIQNRHIKDTKQLAEEFGISHSKFKCHITCINNLTGLLPLKNVADNGIGLNPFFKDIEKPMRADLI